MVRHAHHERAKSIGPELIEGPDQIKFDFWDWFLGKSLSLYRIYEMIEDDMKGKIVQNEWATRSLLERLSRTANHPDSIGDEARHGRQKQDPPKNPMPFSEAKALIETIMHNWLQWKSEQ